jgi:hypothetical protein
MSGKSGPDIVENGLVLCLDAANKFSYPGTGTTWTDLSGNSNNGTLTNGPTFSAGNMGSILYDGADDQIDCGNNSSLNISTNLTLGIWVKFNSLSSDPNLISKQWCSGNQFSYSWAVLSDGRIYYGFDSDGQCSSITGEYTSTNTVCTTGIWYCLNIVHTSTSINLYSNGISIPGTLAGSYGTIYTSTVPVRLGVYRNLSGAFASYLSGNISNVQIYNRALSATEVLQNYNATKSRFGR